MDWIICLPKSLIHEAILWYHLVLGHPGETRLTESMKARFYDPNLIWRTKYCKKYICEDNSTAAKNQNQGYVHLGAREATIELWEEAVVDSFGAWKIIIDNMPLESKALTATNQVTNLFKIQWIDVKTSTKYCPTVFELLAFTISMVSTSYITIMLANLQVGDSNDCFNKL